MANDFFTNRSCTSSGECEIYASFEAQLTRNRLNSTAALCLPACVTCVKIICDKISVYRTLEGLGTGHTPMNNQLATPI